MGKNRVRRATNGGIALLSSHYTTGLGDGHVDPNNLSVESDNNNNNNKMNNDDEAIVQKVIKGRKWNRKQPTTTTNDKQDSSTTTIVEGKDGKVGTEGQGDVTVMFPNGVNRATSYTGSTSTTNRSRLNNNHQGNNNENNNDHEQQAPIVPTNIRYIRGGSTQRSSSSSISYTGPFHRHPIHSNYHSILFDPIVVSGTDPYVEAAPVLYFVCATVIVIVSAVIVHLIAIGGSSSSINSSSNSSANNTSSTNQHHTDGHHHHHNTEPNNNNATNTKVFKKRYSRIIKKKKYDDDWNDDATDDDLLQNDSLRGSNNNYTTGTVTGTTNHFHGGSTSSISGMSDNETSNNMQLSSSGLNNTSSNRLHRTRKNPTKATSASITTVVVPSNAITSHLQPVHHQQQLQLQQPQPLPTSDTAVIGINHINSHRSHYHNEDTTMIDDPTTTCPSKSPIIQHYGRTYATLHQRTNVGYCPPSPIPIPLINNKNNNVVNNPPPLVRQPQQHQSTIVVSDPPIQTISYNSAPHNNNPLIVESRSSDSQQHTRLNARPLSACKTSFDSLLRTDESFTEDDDAHDYINDNLDDVEIGLWDSSTPKSFNNGSFGDSRNPSTSTNPTTIMSPQRETIAVTPRMGQQRQKQLLPQQQPIHEYTPRIVNGGRNRFPLHLPVPEDSPLNNLDDRTNRSMLIPYDPSMPTIPAPPPLIMDSSTKIDLGFATSPKLREQQQRLLRTNQIMASPKLQHRSQQQDQQQQIQAQHPEQMGMPFVPNLSTIVHEMQNHHHSVPQLPQSTHTDQATIFMEWAERVAKENEQLQDGIFPVGSIATGNNNVRDDVLKASQGTHTESSGDPASIPSNDPRKGIHHKREDLTDFTDAAASLQGSIDFNELTLVEVIGGGGFGQVWKASWRGTPVAVKVLTGSAQSKCVPRPVLEEFAAEINLLKGMRHPNICLYMGACLQPPNRAIITELAANGSLWDALRLPLTPPYSPCDGLSRKGWPDFLYEPDVRYGAPPTSYSVQQPHLTIAIPPKGTWHWVLVKRVAFGAARGLCYLHGGKIPVLHRDLKSANILLDESYTAKVCDFGLSRLKAKERSMTGNCGTVQWMAPEVLANQSYNEKADVYSYGVILWELLTRQCPYDKLSPIQCALAVLNRNQRPEIPKWCPPSFHALIRSCWKKDPDERPTFPEILTILEGMPL